MSDPVIAYLERIEKTLAAQDESHKKTVTSLAVITERLDKHIQQTEKHFGSDDEFQKDITEKFNTLDKDHASFRARIAAIAGVIAALVAFASDFAHEVVAGMF